MTRVFKATISSGEMFDVISLLIPLRKIITPLLVPVGTLVLSFLTSPRSLFERRPTFHFSQIKKIFSEINFTFFRGN